MTIKFDTQDRERVADMLHSYDLDAHEDAITEVLQDMEACLQENCYTEEMRYFIEQIVETV